MATLKMASKFLLDCLVWQFRQLWWEGNKARPSVECDHDGNAFASLHVDLGHQRGGRREQQPPLPIICPPKSRNTQTEPINLPIDQGTDPSGLSGPKTTGSIGTQA